jgi:hypothetical protein
MHGFHVEELKTSKLSSSFMNAVCREKNPIHGLINYLDTKASCRHLNKLTCKRDFAAGVYQSLFYGLMCFH